MALITYADKQPLGEQPSIPEVNKVTADNMNEIKSAINGIFNYIYPVGSIYMSVSSTNPGTIFGGTWEQIKGRFLLGTGTPNTTNSDNYFGGMSGTLYNALAGSTGGQDYHTLTANEMPSHWHNFYKTGRVMYWDSGADPLGIKQGTGGDIAAQASWDAKTANSGDGQAHNNMPPYFAVYIWKRTA